MTGAGTEGLGLTGTLRLTAANTFLAVSMSPEPRNPYVDQWSLGVQRQITPGWFAGNCTWYVSFPAAATKTTSRSCAAMIALQGGTAALVAQKLGGTY